MPVDPANPYHPPVGDLRPADGLLPEQTGGFRWRIIPTAFLYLLGGSVLLLGILALGIASYVFATTPFQIEFLLMLLATVMYLSCGMLLILAGRATWRASYRRAFIYAAIAVMIPTTTIYIVGI